MATNEKPCAACEPLIRSTVQGVQVRIHTPESVGSMPEGHIMARLPERLIDYRPTHRVLNLMPELSRSSIAAKLQLSAFNSDPENVGSSVINSGPLAGSSLESLGIQFSDFGPGLSKGKERGRADQEVADPSDINKILEEMREKRLREEAEAKAAAEAKKIREAREKDPAWQEYWEDLAELRRVRDKCVEEARAAHAARDKKIGDALETCLFFGVAGAGAVGAGTAGAAGGPWGALGGAVVGGAIAVLYCYQTAAKDRIDSLLELANDEKRCNQAYEEAFKKLKVPRG